MKCFHFPNTTDPEIGSKRIPWVRSLSTASTISDPRPSGSDPEPKENILAVDKLKSFRFSELKTATKGFSRNLLIGEGGFGCVFKGVIDFDDHKMDVAVKQLNRNGPQGHKEWITEVNFLGIVKHPNLVKLAGYCAEDDERGMQRLLVYELMPNKSLEDHLLGRVNSNLSWPLRLKIAQDAARGLAYLHEEMDFQLIFRDFKTSNILLDENFTAKLSDFGLARHGPVEGVAHISTAVVGTVGYAAPEYIQTGKLTSKSDVWSFGVVLYELITGRRPIDRNLPKNEQKLLEWAKPYATDSKKFHIIIDPRLEGQYSNKSARKLISLANKCLMKNPKSRPKMSEVVEMLSEVIEIAKEVIVIDETINIELNEEEEAVEDEVENCKESDGFNGFFDVKEMMSLRNRCVGKLDWRVFAPGRQWK